MKPKWFYEGYVVYRDKERVFHKEVVCVPVEDFPVIYAEWLQCKNGKIARFSNWYNQTGKDRQKNRSKTFPGIAKAMAMQWAGEVE